MGDVNSEKPAYLDKDYFVVLLRMDMRGWLKYYSDGKMSTLPYLISMAKHHSVRLFSEIKRG